MLKHYLLIVCMLLCGCDYYNNYRSQFILSKGWVGPTDYDKPKPLYCYQTIGQVECYKEPLPGQESRLVSAYEAHESKCADSNISKESAIYEEPHYSEVVQSSPMSITNY